MLKQLLLLGLSLLAVPFLPLPAAAQSLDPTFTPPASLYAPGAVYSMATQQADGKRVVAGYFTRVNGVAVGSLVRLDAAGALDATFAQNVGVARNTLRVKALPSGQYLVSGFYNDAVTAGGLTRTALLRLNASGTADASFNVGTGAASASNDVVQLTTFAGQPDGKVLVGGSFDSFSGRATAGLVRLQADGSLDATFNANLGTGFSGQVNTVAVQPDGKMLVGGSFTALNGLTATALLRLNADGTRDASFAAPLGQNSRVGAILVQPDGKVLLTGYLSINSVDNTIVRLTATGAVDAGFAAPASIYVYNSYSDPDVLLQPDGKVLAAGTFSGSNNAYVIRLNANGTQDNSFAAPNGPSQYPAALGLQSDGSVLVGGSFSSFNGRETGLGRLSSTGAADPAFLPSVQAPGSVAAVVRQADGQLLLGGEFTEYNGVAVRRVVRVSATGALDAAYATATSTLTARVQALALQPDGKLLVGTSGGLRRLLTTGSTDPSYSTFAANGYVEALAVQPDGRTVVAGYLNNASTIPGANPGLLRLTATGDLDASFSPSTAAGPGNLFYTLSLLLQPDGKLLVGGSYFTAGGAPALRVVRYESTGAMDAAFSSSTTFDLPATAAGYVVRLNTLALQPDGKVVVGGYFTSVNGTARTNLARLTATGLLDATFVPPTTLTGAVTALALQPNGRMLVGSGYGNDGTPATTPLLRVLATGALDPSFGTTATPDNAVAALLVQPNGAIVVGGSFATLSGQASPGVARITAPNVLAVGTPAPGAPLSVWPVPAHELLHASAEAGAQATELLDALGRVVRQQALRGAGEFTVATAGLPAGVYVLRVQYASGTVARRVAVE